MPARRTWAEQLSDAAGLLVAALYTVAGQAHFTHALTPAFAADIDRMTYHSHRAFWFLGLTRPQFQYIFGALDLLAAALLWRRPTRRPGLVLAVIGSSGGLYAMLYSGQDALQVSCLLAVSLLGLALSKPQSA